MGFLKWVGVAALTGVNPIAGGVAAAAALSSGGLAESFVDNVVRDKVTPRRGSIVKCDLGPVEHSGIYVGGGKIIEKLSSGDVRKSSPNRFIDGTNAISIYVACNDTEPVGTQSIAIQAESWLGVDQPYGLAYANCHQFVIGCIAFDFENASNNISTFSNLEDVITRELNGGKPITWRVWDLESHELFD